MTRRRGATAVVTTLVAAAAALSAGPAVADERDGGCGTGVAVVVDGNELGGGTRTACAAEPDVASVLFVESGFSLEFQPQLQDFVCKVDGLPTDGRCTDGDSYWSLWWAEPGGAWVYSTLGVSSLEVPAGGSVAFAWHQGTGDAEPPDVEVGDADEVEASPAPAADPTTTEDDAGFPLWLAAGLAGLVLGAAVAVTVVRRRTG
jgi:hypothetical protein